MVAATGSGKQNCNAAVRNAAMQTGFRRCCSAAQRKFCNAAVLQCSYAATRHNLRRGHQIRLPRNPWCSRSAWEPQDGYPPCTMQTEACHSTTIFMLPVTHHAALTVEPSQQHCMPRHVACSFGDDHARHVDRHRPHCASPLKTSRWHCSPPGLRLDAASVPVKRVPRSPRLRNHCLHHPHHPWAAFCEGKTLW